MKAFLLALALSGAAIAVHAAAPFDLPAARPNLLPVQPPSKSCAALETKTVAPDGVPFKRLDQLPPGVLEHAVMRTVGGCPVREIRYEGRTYYVGASPPTLMAMTPDRRAAPPIQAK